MKKPVKDEWMVQKRLIEMVKSVREDDVADLRWGERSTERRSLFDCLGDRGKGALGLAFVE
jgi:hypothetical protein